MLRLDSVALVFKIGVIGSGFCGSVYLNFTSNHFMFAANIVFIINANSSYNDALVSKKKNNDKKKIF